MVGTNDYGSLYHSVARHLICSGRYQVTGHNHECNHLDILYVINCTCIYMHAFMNVTCELWRLMHDLEEA